MYELATLEYVSKVCFTATSFINLVLQYYRCDLPPSQTVLWGGPGPGPRFEPVTGGLWAPRYTSWQLYSATYFRPDMRQVSSFLVSTKTSSLLVEGTGGGRALLSISLFIKTLFAFKRFIRHSPRVF